MTITVYACGGTGINIARQINNNDLRINFIDTSDSNLRTAVGDNVYLAEFMDGAGKDPKLAYEAFKPEAPNVITRMKPGDGLSVVISSLGGGSGAVIGQLVSRELVKGDASVIVIAVVNRSSTKELRNSINALNTYQNLARQGKVPFSLFVVDQPTRSAADMQALYFIQLLSLITDRRRTAEFDRADMKSFLYFDRVTDNDPAVGVLEVIPNTPMILERGTSVVGSIFVTRNKDALLEEVTPEYMATCLVTDSQYTNEDCRINSVLGKIVLITEKLEAELSVLKDQKKVTRVRTHTEVEPTNEDGFCL